MFRSFLMTMMAAKPHLKRKRKDTKQLKRRLKEVLFYFSVNLIKTAYHQAPLLRYLE